MPELAASPITPLRAAPTRKSQPAPKRATAPEIRRNAGVVEQVRVACSKSHRLATFVGALLGAIVPFSTYMVAHNELPDPAWEPRFLLCLALVAGGLLYSARTVYQWGELALTSKVKALGFTVLLEGVMTCSHQEWLSVTALVYLCAINAIATGVTLARGTPAARVTP